VTVRKLLVIIAVLIISLVGSIPDKSLAVSHEEKIESGEVVAHGPMSLVDKLNIIKGLSYDKDAVAIEQLLDLNDAMFITLRDGDYGEIIAINTSYSYDFEKGKEDAYSNPISTYQMPESDYKLTVLVTRIEGKGPQYDNFTFLAQGVWKINPFFEFTDKIALSWSNDFILFNDFSTHYIEKNGKITSSPGVKAEANTKSGVAHKINLVLNATDRNTVLVAQVYKTNSSGTANVVAGYAHAEGVPIVPKVSFGKGRYITFSGTTLSEAKPASASFSY